MGTPTTIVHGVALAAFVVLMLWAAASDLRASEIANWVSVAALAAFLVAAAAAGWGLRPIALNLAAGAAMLLAGLVLFALGVFGGGDVKLLAAAAAWAGFPALPAYLVSVALLGGALALVLIVYRRFPPPRRPAWLRRLHDPATGVPYAVAIAPPAVGLLAGWPIAG